jgi:hypothetical protein
MLAEMENIFTNVEEMEDFYTNVKDMEDSYTNVGRNRRYLHKC